MNQPSRPNRGARGKPRPVAEHAATRAGRRIAARRQTPLEEIEARYQVLVENTPAGVYIVQEGRIVFANRSVAEILGYSVEELLGRDLMDFVVPEDRELVADNVRRRIDGQVESLRYRLRAPHKSGEERTLEVLGSYTTLAGRPAIIGTMLDRTREIHAHEALRKSEANYRMLMDDAADGIFISDAGGVFVDVNAKGCQLLGYAKDELLGMNFRDVVPGDDFQVQPERFGEVLQGATVCFERHVRCKDGSILCVEIHAKCLPDGRVQASLRDITERKRIEKALQDQTRILQSILDSMGDGVAVTDETGEFTIFNPAARRITGFGPEGRTPQEWIEGYGVFLPDRKTPMPPQDLPLARAMRGESVDGAELYLRNANAPHGVWTSVTGRPLVHEDGKTRGGVVVFHDITPMKRAMESLRKAEAKFRALLERLPVVTYTAAWEPLGATLYISPQIEPILGYPKESWLADPYLWSRLLYPGDRERVEATWRLCQGSGATFNSEYRMVARDGRQVWFHDEGVVIRNSEGQAEFVQGVMIDVTDREAERAGRERLAAVSMDLVAMQEEERRRLARELHDDLGQMLTGLKLRLEMPAERTTEELGSRLAEASRRVTELIQHVRDMSVGLRPPVLDDLGLLPALQLLFDRYTKQTSVEVHFEHRGIERRRFAEDLEIAVYRIVQEALHNVARHAGVQDVRVRGWSEGSLLGVQVQDQGIGFDPAGPLSHPSASGLAGMYERVRLLGGELTVEAAPGKGCQVTAEFVSKPPSRRKR